MRGTTHATIGANAVCISIFLGYTVEPWLFLVGAFAALVPDLDASESKIKNMKVSGYIGRQKVVFKPFYLLATLMAGIFRHRGVLHSLAGVALLGLGSSWFIPTISFNVWMIFMIGYITHLVADGITKSGLELFWPIKKRVRLLPKFINIKTGGLIDSLLLVGGSIGVVCFLYKYL